MRATACAANGMDAINGAKCYLEATRRAQHDKGRDGFEMGVDGNGVFVVCKCEQTRKGLSDGFCEVCRPSAADLVSPNLEMIIRSGITTTISRRHLNYCGESDENTILYNICCVYREKSVPVHQCTVTPRAHQPLNNYSDSKATDSAC